MNIISCSRHMKRINHITNARHFGTLEDKLCGPKPLVMVIHPYQKASSLHELLWNSEEALGLAKSANWEIMPGPSLPKGGWEPCELEKFQQTQEHLLRHNYELFNQWHFYKDEDSKDNEEFQSNTQMGSTFNRQWAESCLIRMRRIDSKFFFGKGKLAELKEIFNMRPCRYIFINTFLTPKQHYFLEDSFNQILSKKLSRNDDYQFDSRVQGPEFEYLKISEYETEDLQYVETPKIIEVVDRYRIIIEIFTQRAHNSEARLQIESARLLYIKSKIRWNTISYRSQIKFFTDRSSTILHDGKDEFNNSLSQFLSSNETVEQYYRRIFDELRYKIKSELRSLKKNRELQRKGRKDSISIAVVGYTNAGKTALINRLCNSNLKVRDMLFQTLNVAYKSLRLENGIPVILIDSVGFIQHLPNSILKAFQAVLEEITEADLLLHVRDISHPRTKEQHKTVVETLQNIGISDYFIENRLIEVWNKIDLLNENDVNTMFTHLPQPVVLTSAIDGLGIDILIKHLSRLVESIEKTFQFHFTFPTIDAPSHLKFLRAHCHIIEESYKSSEDGKLIFLDAITNLSSLKKYQKTFRNICSHESFEKE